MAIPGVAAETASARNGPRAEEEGHDGRFRDPVGISEGTEGEQPREEEVGARKPLVLEQGEDNEGQEGAGDLRG